MSVSSIRIESAAVGDSATVAALVEALLMELEPAAEKEIQAMNLHAISGRLMANQKIHALLAYDGEQAVAVLTLHACAAIYAGGEFGEISEFYVAPAYRSAGVGVRLLNAAKARARQLGWQRLEVGAPPVQESPRTLAFYQTNGFKQTGERLRLLID